MLGARGRRLGGVQARSGETCHRLPRIWEGFSRVLGSVGLVHIEIHEDKRAIPQGSLLSFLVYFVKTVILIVLFTVFDLAAIGRLCEKCEWNTPCQHPTPPIPTPSCRGASKGATEGFEYMCLEVCEQCQNTTKGPLNCPTPAGTF